MITNQIVSILYRLRNLNLTNKEIAFALGCCEKTISKWIKLGKLPGEVKLQRDYLTHSDIFSDVKDEIIEILRTDDVRQLP